jgi:hypothetical protein
LNSWRTWLLVDVCGMARVESGRGTRRRKEGEAKHIETKTSKLTERQTNKRRTDRVPPLFSIAYFMQYSAMGATEGSKAPLDRE